MQIVAVGLLVIGGSQQLGNRLVSGMQKSYDFTNVNVPIPPNNNYDKK